VLYENRVPYKIGNCNTSNLFLPYFADNKFYTRHDREVAFNCTVDGISKLLSLKQWQALGLDPGTTAQTTPDIQTIIQWGREMLQGAA
jgi:hypothetical protein